MRKRLSFTFVFILCEILGVTCWSTDTCNGCRSSEYSRNKRAKYNSLPSYKYYNRPIYGYSNRAPVYGSSFGYPANDIGQLTSKPRPYKVSKRPFNEDLGDEDFINLIKGLSKKELNRIVEFAAENEIYSDDKDSDNYEYGATHINSNDVYYEEDSPRIYYNDPNLQYAPNKHNFVYRDRDTNYQQGQASMDSEIPTNIEDSEEFEQLSLLDEYIHRDVEIMNNKNNIFTDSSTLREEELPKPINLREDYYGASSTNNVPAITKPESAYRLVNFADLPLMGYENSKLEKVNSYSVPHYSVISSSNHPRPRFPLPPSLTPPQTFSSSALSTSILSLINAPEVEPAPPVSSAKEQSDAHLKATKIWTHKSQGTAYVLHDDGTLSLEKPSSSRYNSP